LRLLWVLAMVEAAHHTQGPLRYAGSTIGLPKNELILENFHFVCQEPGFGGL
jgi:hypothetical protein